MSVLVRLAVKLYPSAWRRRYERELIALIDDAGADWRCLGDVLIGAVKMRLQTGALVVVGAACAGLLIGGLWSLTTPALYAATATVQMPLKSDGDHVRHVRAALQPAFNSGTLAPQFTSVAMRPTSSANAVIRVSYSAASAADAQRAADQLVRLLATSASAQILEPPVLPTESLRADAWPMMSVGGAAGALIGTIAFVIASRRRLNA
jgi:hypothetical protein